MAKKTTTKSSTARTGTRKRASASAVAPESKTKRKAPATRVTAKGTRRTATPKRSSGDGDGAVPESGNVSGKSLVIVESPAKAKTIGKYLGPDYRVRATRSEERRVGKGG